MSALRTTTLAGVAATLALAAANASALTARQIYEAASPSVVVVVATNASDPSNAGIGSGSIVAADGLILTNFHVVRMGEGGVADTIRVFFKPARLSGSLNKDLQDGVRAAVVATDPGRDLALLSVSPRSIKAPPIPITEQLATPGDPSVAIGSPVDGGPWTLTTGAISNRILDLEGKMGKHAYQIETPINPGNSGGALLDADASLLGVTTSAVKIGRGGLPTANIQFAVANDVVLDFIQSALVSRQEFRELPAGDQVAVAKKYASRAASGKGSVVDGCAYGVCRVAEESALDRIWARMTRLAGAAGAQRFRLLSRNLASKDGKVASAVRPGAATETGGVRGVAGEPVETGVRGAKPPPAGDAESDESLVLTDSAAGSPEPAAAPSPSLDAARATVTRLFGGQRAPVPAGTASDPAWAKFEREQFGGLPGAGDGEGGTDALTLPPSAAELEELLPGEEGEATAAAAEPLPEVTSGTTEWLSSPVRAARLSAVRWATRPLFARATSGCAGKAAASCVTALSSTRPERIAGDGAGQGSVQVASAPSKPPAARPPLRRSITLDDYATTTRPIEREQLSAVGKQLAADKGAKAAESRDAVVGMLFRGEFREALATVKKAPELRTLDAAAEKFVRAEKDLSARRFNGARTALRSIRQPEDMKRLADYWICKSMRLERRPIGAEQCFKKGGMTEGILP